MGSFGAWEASHHWQLQMLYSAVKLPLLIAVTFAISVPSFFVLNTLFGLRNDFPRAMQSLLATQVGFTIFLAAFAPLVLFWYASFSNYNHAVATNGVMFAVSSLASQRLLRGYYAPLVARNPRHRMMLWVWTGVYALVAIQLAWLLRPFVGSPAAPVEFFREGAWDNAYIIISKLVWRILVG